MSPSTSESFFSDCPFCLELATGGLPSSLRTYSHIPNRIIQASEHFVVFPTISPLIPGHLLIIPRYHVSSLLQIRPDHVAEFLDLLATVLARTEQIYSPPIFFEHGIGKDCIGGCGINHAHLHILPVPTSTIEEVKDAYLIPDVFTSLHTYSLNGIFRTHAMDRHSYALIGRTVDIVYFQVLESLPSQYLRKHFSLLLNKSFWDWRELFGKEDFLRSYDDHFSSFVSPHASTPITGS